MVEDVQPPQQGSLVEFIPCIAIAVNGKLGILVHIWVFPKIGVPPNHPF